LGGKKRKLEHQTGITKEGKLARGAPKGLKMKKKNTTKKKSPAAHCLQKPASTKEPKTMGESERKKREKRSLEKSKGGG